MRDVLGVERVPVAEGGRQGVAGEHHRPVRGGRCVGCAGRHAHRTHDVPEGPGAAPGLEAPDDLRPARARTRCGSLRRLRPPEPAAQGPSRWFLLYACAGNSRRPPHGARREAGREQGPVRPTFPSCAPRGRRGQAGPLGRPLPGSRGDQVFHCLTILPPSHLPARGPLLLPILYYPLYLDLLASNCRSFTI